MFLVLMIILGILIRSLQCYVSADYWSAFERHWSRDSGATQMDGPMGGTFGIRPVARDGNLGIMANFTVPFEDGGPVRMFMGGDPQAYGEGV